MSDLSTDRWGRLNAWPIFFPLPTKETRSVPRALAALGLCALFFFPAGMVGMVAAPAVAMALALANGEGLSYPEAAGWMAAVLKDGTQDFRDELMLLAFMGAVFTALTGALIAALKITHPHQVAKRYITSALHFRWRLFLVGSVLFGVVMAVALILTSLTAPGTLQAPILDVSQALRARLVYAAVLLLVLPIAAAFEEILCRGWMVQQTAAWTRSLPVILLLNAVIFSAMHLDPDPGRNLSRMVVGAAFAWGALRLGGLEFSIGAHTVNNLMIALFASTLGRATDVSQASKVGDVITDLCTTAAMIAAIELAARWKPLRRWAQVDEPEEPADAFR